MPISTAALVEALCQTGLIPPDDVEELTRRAATESSDARALAKQLVQRGWLTVFQINQLLQGAGHDLVVGPYRLLDLLGEGGISQVFKAWDTQRPGHVALKILRADLIADTGSVRQFQREIQAVTSLSHPNVVGTLDSGEVRGRHYFAMEYLEGTDLGRILELSGPLPVAEACSYVRQAALGLQHAHQRNLVHRDIKPANLLLTHVPGDNASRSRSRARPQPPPAEARIKILDWGLARMKRPDPFGEGDMPGLISGWVQKGMLLGTADYLPPEQAENAVAVDSRSDLYSLGCTCYHLLTGQPPFPGGSLLQKLLNHETGQPTPVQALRPGLPEGLAAVVHKMMAKRLEDRYQTAAAVAVTLAPFCRPGGSSAGSLATSATRSAP
jgi:serine/threonine-protein kinase